jgi:hypothetical protein
MKLKNIILESKDENRADKGVSEIPTFWKTEKFFKEVFP